MQKNAKKNFQAQINYIKLLFYLITIDSIIKTKFSIRRKFDNWSLWINKIGTSPLWFLISNKTMFSYLNQKYLTFLFSLPTENSISLKSISLVNLAIYLFPCKYSKTKILYSKYKYSVVIKWKYNLRRKSLSKNKKSMDYF